MMARLPIQGRRELRALQGRRGVLAHRALRGSQVI